MTTTVYGVTFNGQVLSNVEVFETGDNGTLNEVKLLDNTNYVQTAPPSHVSYDFVCHTEDFTEITNLRSYEGSPYTLVVDGNTFTKCFIKPPIKSTMDSPGKYTYKISFTQHTAQGWS